jgi:oxepin-CoA hydrolase/3-oxo-5,6-dehydrosuberyl-CoA semialdehyde dehydrogenase
MGYRDLPHAAAIANRGGGSLVTSVITHDPETARELTMSVAAWNGRIYLNDRASMAEATGHGAPMPHMIHGGPGRAGGGEEMGGVRGVKHFMQRTAIQGGPDMLTAVTGPFVPGGTEKPGPAHPFRRRFHDLEIGETLVTDPRTITMDDIDHFAHFTGDKFYAHLNEAAAARNPFFPGVEPAEGPVLANTGLDRLRFLKPLTPGSAITVHLTVKQKTPRNEDYGEVRWYVKVVDQTNEMVAEYELLTMVAY